MEMMESYYDLIILYYCIKRTNIKNVTKVKGVYKIWSAI